MKVLIIDDSSASRLSIAKLLKKIIENIEISQSSCGKDALSTLASDNNFELIILDLGLPDIGGLEVLKQCRDLYHKTPIITISDESSQEILKKSIKMGAIEYLTKPLHHKQFEFVLNNKDLNLTFNNITPKILIVDDAKINRLLLKKIFKKINYETMEASNGVEAVELAGLHNFDCILMDINMPIMDGFEATEKIRIRDKNTPIIAVTTEQYNAILNKCITIGFNLIHEKPVKKDMLLQAISDLMHLRFKGNLQKI